jgi:hypothetical protein
MSHVYNIGTSGQQVFRFQVDLSVTTPDTGTTSDATGTVLATLSSLIPGAEYVRVVEAGICAVTAGANLGNATTLNVFLQKNGGNNVEISSSGGVLLTASSGGAIAIGTQDQEIGDTAVAKKHLVFTGVTAKTLKLVLAKSQAFSASPSGLIEIAVVLEYVKSK